MANGLARAGFDLDLRYGQMREGELAQILALRGPLMEVKADDPSPRTGNFFVELRQKERRSGLLVTESQWWAFRYDGETWALLSADKVRRLVERALRAGYASKGGDGNTQDGALVPVRWVLT